MFLLYFVLWVVFNGSLTLEICLFGLVIASALFAFSCKFMGHNIARELSFYKNAFLAVCYVCLLLKEIVRANLGVVRLILTQKEEIEPALVSFHTDLKTSAGKAFLANAITLTPGTITVTLEGDEYTVHCLDGSMAEGIKESGFAEYIRKLEKERGISGESE